MPASVGSLARTFGRIFGPNITNMKTILAGLCALLMAALLAPSASAQPESRASSGVEETIRSLENQERLPVLAGDTATLERLWSATMIVNTPQSSISADRGVVLDLVRKGLIRYSSFERAIEAIRVDGDIAIVMGSEEVVPIGDAPHAGQTVHRRFTNIWKMKGTTWVMIARHANGIPLKQNEGAEQGAASNGSQPFGSGTNRTSSAAGSRR